MSMAMLPDEIQEFINTHGCREFETRLEFSAEAQVVYDFGDDFWSLIESGIVTANINGDRVEKSSDVKGFATSVEVVLTLLKNRMLEKNLASDDDVNVLAFITQQGFQEWLAQCPQPFSAKHPFYKKKRTAIIVFGIKNELIGESLSIFPENLDAIKFSRENPEIPDDEKIRSNVHFLISHSAYANPLNFRLPLDAWDNDIFLAINQWYRDLLCICIAKEVRSDEKVVIAGIKRVELPLGSDVELPERNKIEQLEEAVRWIYEERVETRSLLFIDRISLDIDGAKPFANQVFDFVSVSLDQAISRYKFVIVDRKEAHAKELADLQKDIKSASDGFSKTTNELISSLFKDALYTFLVIFGAFITKVVSKEAESIERYSFVFYFLSAYLLISASVKIYFSYSSGDLSSKSMAYWKETIRNHMSDKEINQHIKKCMTPYKIMMRKALILSGFIYSVLFFGVLFLPCILKDDALSVTADPKIKESSPPPKYTKDKSALPFLFYESPGDKKN